MGPVYGAPSLISKPIDARLVVASALDGEKLCLRIALDPTTPIISVVQGAGGEVLIEPVLVNPEARLGDLAQTLRGKRAALLVYRERGGYRAVAPEALAARLGDLDARIGELPAIDLPVVGENDSIESLASLMLAGGSPYALIVDERGEPVAAVGLQLLSRLLQEEIDVEELRGAD